MRKYLQRISTLFILMLLTLAAFAQSTIKGKVIDAVTKEPLIGATVGVKGTTNGVAVNLDGSFKINTSTGVTLVISYVGFNTKEVVVTSADLGALTLEPSNGSMKEVVVSGTLNSVAIDRKTPIAVTSVNATFIEEKLGNQEFPEMLKSAPGVMVTKQGGGFGDSRLSIRGFKQANVAVIINGMPINDMENGAVFWSNWSALSDVTSSLQAQRGLGASKVAVPSLGGTVNVVTRTTDAKKGGSISQSIGSDGYLKTAVAISTGLDDNGWAFSALATKTEGNGNADGLNFRGYNYFFNVSKVLTANQTLSLTLIGAQQRHGQRSTKSSIDAYRNASMGIKYNQDWGYRNGQVVNIRDNFYTKPILSLNHSWTIDDKSSLSTVVYASKGTGGGGSSNFNFNTLPHTGDAYSPFDLDAVQDANVANPDGSSINYLRAARNDHEWYGAISTYKKKITPEIDLLAGADLRYYIGRHFTEVTDLLGGKYLTDNRTSVGNGDINNPIKRARVGDKIIYNNDSNVAWEGGFLQAEYSKNDLSAFVSVAGSNTSYKRIDYFNYLNSDPMQTTPFKNYFGYQAKGGANYNIDSHHNVFANVGYLSKAPFFNVAFVNNTNVSNPVAKNEKLLSYELGYGYRSAIFSANVNLYRTDYKDRSSAPRQATQNGQTYYANITGINELHQGVEVDFKLRPVKDVTLSGSLSIGDWTYTNSVGPVTVFDEANQPVTGQTAVYYNLKGLKVGDQAQTSAGLNLDVNVSQDLKIGGNWNYYTNYYADFSYTSASTTTPNGAPLNTWKMPAYHLFDINAVFKFKFAGLNSELIGNMNNVFNTSYISDALDSNNTGLAKNNLVFYGIGRTITTTLKIKF
jgi:iron complex outermembrane receptor protein